MRYYRQALVHRERPDPRAWNPNSLPLVDGEVARIAGDQHRHTTRNGDFHKHGVIGIKQAERQGFRDNPLACQPEKIHKTPDPRPGEANSRRRRTSPYSEKIRALSVTLAWPVTTRSMILPGGPLRRKRPDTRTFVERSQH